MSKKPWVREEAWQGALRKLGPGRRAEWIDCWRHPLGEVSDDTEPGMRERNRVGRRRPGLPDGWKESW